MSCPHCASVGYLKMYPQQPFQEAVVYDCKVLTCGRLSYFCNGQCRTLNEPNSVFKKAQYIKSYKTQERLVLHLNRYHPSAATNIDANTETDDEVVNNLCDVDTHLVGQPMVPPVVMHSSMSLVHNSNSLSMTRFINWCFHFTTVFATRKLLCLASYQKTDHDSLTGSVNVDSLQMFLSISRIVVTFTWDNQQHLSTLLRMVWQFLPHINSSWMPIPITVNQFQRHILNRQNQNSLMSLIPIPKVTLMSDNDHTYCHLAEVLGYATFFSKPTGYSMVEPKHQQLVHSLYVQQFIAQVMLVRSSRDDNVLCLSLFWMDGYDPNRSTKGNRKGAWAGTQTFILADLKDQKVYYVDTLLFASGPGKGSKKEDHSIVIQQMVADKTMCYHLDGSPKPLKLRSMFHDKRIVDFYVLTIAGLMDNPERRADYGLLQGNSKLHGYFGMSCAFSKLDRPFPACPQCAKLVTDIVSHKKWDQVPFDLDCPDCYGWSIDKVIEQGTYLSWFPPPPNSELAPGRQFFFGPGMLTNEKLLQAWQYAIARFAVDNTWNVGETKDYLKIHCINDDLQCKLIEQCRQYMDYVEHINDPLQTEEWFAQEIACNLLLDAQFYDLPRPPPAWHLCPLQFACETPMHLQMNFVHFNASFMFDWAKERGKGAVLIRQARPLFENAQQLHVAGLKIILFKTDKFGGYVAENWRAFANIAPWVFTFLEDQSMMPPPPVAVPDPETVDVGRWMKGQLMAWLHVRRLTVAKELRKPELAIVVRRYLLSSSCPKAIGEAAPRVVSATTIRKMHLQVSRYCQSLMATDLTGKLAENRTTAHAMVYLSLMDTAYKTMHGTLECNLWMQTYTLLGILRAPTHFRDYLWVRSLYEGGDMGEGVVKHLRPLSPTGVKMNWSFHVVEGYYRRLTLSFLQQFLTPENQISDRSKIDHRRFVRYGTRADLQDKMENGIVLSILILEDTSSRRLIIGSMIVQFKQQYLCEYSLSNQPIFEDKLGFVYFKLDMTSTEHSMVAGIHPKLRLLQTGFALPLLAVHPLPNGYCIMSDEGDCLNKNHKFETTL